MKINFLKTTLATIFIPLMVISCSSNLNQLNGIERLRKELKKYDFTAPNKWIDNLFNEENGSSFDDSTNYIPPTDAFKDGEGSPYQFGHNNTTLNHPKSVKDIISNPIKTSIKSEDYSIDKIKKSFDFTDDINNQAIYIQNFVDIYSKWDNSNVLGYEFNNYQENPNSKMNRNIVWIGSSGGPTGRVVKTAFQNEATFASLYSYHDYYNIQNRSFDSNVLPVFYNQPQYDFIPDELIENFDSANKNALISKINPNKRAKYLKKINDKSLTKIEAFQLMLGNTTIPLGRMLENISEAMAFISSIRKRDLIDHYKSQNFEVVLSGASYGYKNQLEDIMLDKTIIKDILGGFVWVNYMNKTIPGSTRISGGLMTEDLEKISSGNPGTVDPLLAWSLEYYKNKYGFIQKYKSLFQNDKDFKKDFVDKILIAFSPKDFNVGEITNYERKFYDDNGIYYYEDPNQNGHNMIIRDKNIIYSKILKYTKNEGNMSFPKYQLNL